MADSGTHDKNEAARSKKALRQLRSLHQAIEKNDLQLVKSWLSSEGIDVNRKIDGLSAVQVAARRADADIYNLIFDFADADLSVISENGSSLLHLACERQDDNVALVTYLLQLGISPNICDTRDHETPLMVSLRRWRPNVCEALIKHSETDFKVVDARSETPLFRAAQIGNAKLVRLLLTAGTDRVDVDHVNMYGMTALMAAVNPWFNPEVLVMPELRRVAAKQDQADRADCVTMLLANGADTSMTDKSSRTVLEQVALFGRSDCLRIILDTGLNPNKLPDGRAPLAHQLVSHDLNHYEELGILVHHPRFNAKAKYRGLTLIDNIIITGSRAILPSQGAIVGDAVKPKERELRYEVFIEPLIALGCSIGGRTKDGVTAVQVAIEIGRPRILELLLKAGLNPNYEVDDKKNTLLHRVVNYELQDLVAVLLKANASKEALNSSNLRPFEMLEFKTTKGEKVLKAFLDEQTNKLSTSMLFEFLSRCIQRSRDKGVELLLGRDVPLDHSGWPSALYTWATCVLEREMLTERLGRHMRIGQMLLNHPKVNHNRAVGSNGSQVVPLHAAIDAGNALLMRVMLDHPQVNMFETDSLGDEAMTHVLRFPDRRMRLQMTRILVGRGYHLPLDPDRYSRWMVINSNALVTAPWPLFRLLCVALLHRLMLSGSWRRMFNHAAMLRGALESVETELLLEVPRVQVTMPLDLVSTNTLRALELFMNASQLPKLVDLARDAVRARLGAVTRQRVQRLPLPPRLHSHLLLETTFEDMPTDDGLGQELESGRLEPLSEAVCGVGGVEDWPVISFLSASAAT